MIRLAALALLGASLGAQAQQAEIQRALVERDQQSAAFALGISRRDVPPAASALHARQLSEVMAVPLSPELRPWQRFRMAEERALVLPPPRKKETSSESKPLPLPGGWRGGVDPVLPQGFAY
jgi:hypothetical protein